MSQWTLDHPEHERNKQKALWASGNLPMADKSALPFAMRRPKSSSHHSLDPIGVPKSFKLVGPVPRAPLEVTRAERLGGVARGDDLGLVQVDREPNAAEAFSLSDEEAPNGWSGTSTKTVIEENRAEIDAPRVRGLRSCAGLRNGRVDSEGEKDRAEEIPLLHSPGAGDDLRGNAAGASEEGALTAVTSVDPRREGRKVDADGPQDG